MAERRGLGAAMALTPDKMAFIKTGLMERKPAAESVATEVPSPSDSGSPSEMVQGTSEFAAELDSPRQRPSRPTRSRDVSPTRSKPQEPIEEVGGFYGQILVPLTTRLQPKTADALRRACLEQKLARKSPHTQQEIVEGAILAWLRAHQFLD